MKIIRYAILKPRYQSALSTTENKKNTDKTDSAKTHTDRLAQ